MRIAKSGSGVRKSWSYREGLRGIPVLVLVSLLPFWAGAAAAGPYRDSAHGSSTIGVKRTATELQGYSKGNCAHCHEVHMSINGVEPDPVNGIPSPYLVFAPTPTGDPANNFCLQCHRDSGSKQSGGQVKNRSYSYRAGNWTVDTLSSVLEAFTTGGPLSILSSHNLDDIRTLVTSKSWGYTTSSNPCAACHNPHAAKGDPADAPDAAKSAGTRGYPLIRPSQHVSSPTNLWGDGAGEKTSDYTLFYQAPYRYNTIVAYEPDGSATVNGSNLTDMNTFCMDCHNKTNVIYSSTLGRNLYKIDWDIAKHGNATNPATHSLKPPYTNGQPYCLACTDCHDPHGSPSVALIRREVNYGTTGHAPVLVTTLLGTNADFQGKCNKEWVNLCSNCHFQVLSGDGHVHTTPGCACHVGGCIYPACGTCHFHGNNMYLGAPWGSDLF